MMSYEDVLRGLFLDDATPSGRLEPDQIRSTIAQTPVSEIVYFLQKHQDELSDVSAKNIPQFSNIDEVDKVLFLDDDVSVFLAERPQRLMELHVVSPSLMCGMLNMII